MSHVASRLVALVAALLCAAGSAPARQGPDAPLAAPDTRNYRIGAGDVLEIRVLGEEQLSSPSVRVREDGSIQSPFIDEDIRVQCLTEREASAASARVWSSRSMG